MPKELKTIRSYPRRMPKDRNETLLRSVKNNLYNRVERIGTWLRVVDTNNDGP